MAVAELFDLSGRVAFVTGASSGIGKSIALARASAGAAVVLVARSAGGLDVPKTEIDQSGAKAAGLPCDLADRVALRACVARAADYFGAPDIIVCGAGVSLRARLLEVTDAAWDTTMRVNLEAPFFLAQGLAPAMIDRGWGRIINIASLQSVRAFPDCAPYGASKGAIAQLTRAQAEAWSSHGVNANAIAPGFFATALTAPVANDPVRCANMARRPLPRRHGQLPDPWGAALFLARRAAHLRTRQTLVVGGVPPQGR